jgi:hypothetical protein
MKLLVAGVIAMVWVVALSAVAEASAPYVVGVRVESHTAPLNARRRVAVGGQSANASRLTVYLGPHGCAKHRSVEAVRPKTKLVISAKVVGSFSTAKVFVGKGIGKRYACAYLTGVAPNVSVQYAAAKARYVVTPRRAMGA